MTSRQAQQKLRGKSDQNDGKPCKTLGARVRILDYILRQMKSHGKVLSSGVIVIYVWKDQPGYCRGNRLKRAEVETGNPGYNKLLRSLMIVTWLV